MKRNFLLLSVFFLISCTSDVFQDNAGCPIKQGRQITLEFEYNSAELNEKAVSKLKKIARKARERSSFVCFLGRLAYQGVPSGQALGAMDRVKNTAAIFLKEGVNPAQIYIGMAPENPRIGFSKPQNAEEEKHTLNLLIEP